MPPFSAFYEEKIVCNKKKLFLKHICIFGSLFLVLLLYRVLGITCIYRFLFGIPCPTCGVTRSVLSLLKLDFTASFRYNPMTVPLLVFGFLMIHRRLFPKWKLFIEVGAGITLILLFAVYIFRLKNGWIL